MFNASGPTLVVRHIFNIHEKSHSFTLNLKNAKIVIDDVYETLIVFPGMSILLI